MNLPRTYRLHIIVSLLFSLLVLGAGGTIAWLGYIQSRAIALAAADDAFERTGREVKASLEHTFEPVARIAHLLADQPIARASNLQQRIAGLPALRLLLDGRTPIAAAYVGYADGGFVLLRPVPDAATRKLLNAPKQTAYHAQIIDFDQFGQRRATLLFFDDRLHELSRSQPAVFDFDPRVRPWYRLARVAGEVVMTKPYTFFLTRSPGMTMALRTDAGSVVGIDVTLQQVAQTLSAARVYPGMELVLFDDSRHVLANPGGRTAKAARKGTGLELPTLSDSDVGVLADLQPAASDAAPTTQDIRSDGGRIWKTVVLPLPTRRGVLSLGVAVPIDELLAGAYAIRDRGLLAALGVLLLALPLTWWVARSIARTLREVTREAREIEMFKLDGTPAGPSRVLEVDQLSSAVTRMRDTIRRFLDISSSLAAERDFPTLLRRVVRETASITGASGGLVYLLDADNKRLRPASFVPPADREASMPDSPVDANASAASTDALRENRTVVKMIEPGQHGPDTAYLENLYPGSAVLLLAFPLRTRDGVISGVLVLFSPKATAPSNEHVGFAEALSGTAAVAIENQQLLEARKALLDAFIKLIAGAIDAKSPYTGGHCARVPELTMMLAQSACDARDGPLQDFALSPEEWEELQIASWLHDCGKVTTPEYVVDKATKLETISDRIHEVRTRFEVLKRDVEIEHWKAVAAGADAIASDARRSAAIKVLDEEFAFVAACNLGGESLSQERVQRLHEIGARTWLRTLDDRIGISHEEKTRKAATPPAALPVLERLLADKPEHLVPHGPHDEHAHDERFNFRMQVPEHKYNRGELHNLSVARGTLTDEERYVINHHIVQTITMLSQLPFPKHLRRVPEIAGGHHETMIGTGYPRRLSRKDMSWTTRMMAIADIFEALTAADRPYKQGKMLSEAIRIMSAMKRARHIDSDLFDLFLTSGTYRRYAERFLRPEQIDAVDIQRHLGSAAMNA